MTFLSLLRDNENLSGDMLGRIIGSAGGSLGNIYDAPLPPGIGTGSFAVGVVGKMNGAAGADPNHFSVQANGTTLVLTVRPGWIWIRRDSGAASLDPRCVFVEMTAAQTVTLAANNQGSTRVDQICLRYDLTTPPDATGSNVPSLFIVQGGAASALGAAPADAGTGALYVVLATVIITNTATNVAQSAVTDKRYAHPSQLILGAWLASAQSIPNGGVFTPIAFDTKDDDPCGAFTTGAGAKYTVPTPGLWASTGHVRVGSPAALNEFIATIYKNGADYKRTRDDSINPGGAGFLGMTLAGGGRFAAGDTVQWAVWQNSAAAQAVATGQALAWVQFRWLQW